MRILYAISIAVSMFVLSACSSVYSSLPVGEKVVSVKPEDWQGNWMLSTTPTTLIEIKVANAEKGMLTLTWLDANNKVTTYVVTLRESGGWTFANIQDEGKALFAWGRIKRNGDQVLIWLPRVERFRDLVKAGKLPGTLTEGSLAEDPGVILGNLKPSDLKLITSGDKGTFDWESPIIATPALTPDVRNVRWGMSPTEVKKAESGTPKLEEPDLLAYRVDLAGIPVTLAYKFGSAGKLEDILYDDTQHHSDLSRYIEDFNHIFETLESKYGPPNETRGVSMKWISEQFKADKQKWGAALAMGHLTMLSKWSTPRTFIALVADGEYGSAHVRLVFSDVKALKEFRESVTTKHAPGEPHAKCSEELGAVKADKNQSTGVTSFSTTASLDRTVTSKFYWTSDAPDFFTAILYNTSKETRYSQCQYMTLLTEVGPIGGVSLRRNVEASQDSVTEAMEMTMYWSAVQRLVSGEPMKMKFSVCSDEFDIGPNASCKVQALLKVVAAWRRINDYIKNNS